MITPRIIKKKSPEVQRQLNLRQQKVVSLVSANVCKSRADVLRQAGYKESVARSPDHVFQNQTLKEALAPVEARLTEIRDNMINALSKKDFSKESPMNLTIMSSTLTKMIELLSGRPTERERYELPQEEKDHIRRLLELNRNSV